ncbi:hypothetical protein NIES2101_32715 [Calothrix sp. HK-06]|nr:hypothetical protein NIES2101_32715 [Calothrix sp. HK-06]
MSYCLNPNCQNPSNPDHLEYCLICSTNLLLNERYRAIKFLGAGGMGRNFLAVDECTPKRKYCVIKQFFPIAQITEHPTAFQKAVELFNREAAMLDELGDESTQIPRLLAHIEQDSRLYLVQEFIDGQNLLKKLEQELIASESQIIQLLADILPVLQFIHERGVVHRDIKPENIMWRHNKPPVLIDFGISKELSNTVMTIGTTVGTVGYAPIEQMTYGESYPASDIYALGTTCIHLLTGTFPSLLYNPQKKCWIWRSVMESNNIVISKQLGQILDKMLQEDIRKRYQSAEEVLQDLLPLSLGSRNNHQNQQELSEYKPLNKYLSNIHQDVLALPPTLQHYFSYQPNKIKILLIAGAVILLGFGINGFLQAISRPTANDTTLEPTLTASPSVEPTPTASLTEPPLVDCTSTSICLYKGLALYQEKKYDAAVEYYNQAILYDSNNVAAYYNRGLIRVELGDKQGALEEFNKAIELDPSYIPAYENRGILRQELGDKPGALEDYNQVLFSGHKSIKAYKNRGLLRAEIDDKQGALEDYNEVIKMEPQNAIAYYNLGIFNQKLDNKQEALKDYNQAIKLDATYVDAYYNRGILQQQLNNNKEAIKDFQTAAELYGQQGKEAEKQDALNQIKKLQSKPSKSTTKKPN